MDTQKYTTMIVGFAIAIVLVAGLMVPVISSLSNESGNEGYTNVGNFYYTEITNDTYFNYYTDYQDDEEGFTYAILDIYWYGENDEYLSDTYTIGPVWTIGDEYDSYSPTLLPLLIFETEDGLHGAEGFGSTITHNTYEDSFMGSSMLIYWRATPYLTESGVMYDFQTWDLNLDHFDDDYPGIVLENGSPRYSIPMGYGDDIPLDIPVTYILALSDQENGSYVYTSDAKVSSNDAFYFIDAVGPITGSPSDIGCEGTLYEGYGYGTITDITQSFGFDGTLFDSANNEVLAIYSDEAELHATLNATQSNGLYTLNDITVTGTSHEIPDLNISAQFSKFIVPVEISGDGSSSGLSDTMVSMISVIPLVTVIGLVIGAVGYLRIRE